jgi:hypothetical protein
MGPLETSGKWITVGASCFGLSSKGFRIFKLDRIESFAGHFLSVTSCLVESSAPVYTDFEVLIPRGSMRVYIGFDDTDNPDSDFGTGKVARRYENRIPENCRVWGVVRQQLLVDPGIPYTSHNSSACVIVDIEDPSLSGPLAGLAADHIEGTAAAGSDPGICLVCEDDPALPGLVAFGKRCTERIVTQRDAIRAAGRSHLSGHGGNNDGIIGAAAAVGLTASGWSGRFIELSDLRRTPDPVSVGALRGKGIRVVSLDRDAACPGPRDMVNTKGWLRPRLWGGEAVLPVMPAGPGLWQSLGEKRKKSKT